MVDIVIKVFILGAVVSLAAIVFAGNGTLFTEVKNVLAEVVTQLQGLL